jgi:hypothetical protein
MLPFKKILCPTDFSDPSYESLKAAAELAGHFAGDLYLGTHPADPTSILRVRMMPPLTFHQEELKKALKNLQSDRTKVTPGCRSILVVLGHPSRSFESPGPSDLSDRPHMQ